MPGGEVGSSCSPARWSPGSRSSCPNVRRRLVFYVAVAAGFVFLSADEILSLHERLMGFNKTYELHIPMIRDHGAWITVYTVAFMVFTLMFLRPILQIAAADPHSSATICGGLAVVVLGGVGAEVLGYLNVLALGTGPQVLIEETLELLGVSVVVLGCARHVLWVIDSAVSPTAPAAGSHRAAQTEG